MAREASSPSQHVPHTPLLQTGESGLHRHILMSTPHDHRTPQLFGQQGLREQSVPMTPLQRAQLSQHSLPQTPVIPCPIRSSHGLPRSKKMIEKDLLDYVAESPQVVPDGSSFTVTQQPHGKILFTKETSNSAGASTASSTVASPQQHEPAEAPSIEVWSFADLMESDKRFWG